MRRNVGLQATIEFSEADGIQTLTAGADRLISWDENGEYVYYLQELNDAGTWEQREQCADLGDGMSGLFEAIDFRQSASVIKYFCSDCGRPAIQPESTDQMMYCPSHPRAIISSVITECPQTVQASYLATLLAENNLEPAGVQMYEIRALNVDVDQISTALHPTQFDTWGLYATPWEEGGHNSAGFAIHLQDFPTVEAAAEVLCSTGVKPQPKPVFPELDLASIRSVILGYLNGVHPEDATGLTRRAEAAADALDNAISYTTKP